jgi:D-xylose transport system substrate-binding protein
VLGVGLVVIVALVVAACGSSNSSSSSTSSASGSASSSSSSSSGKGAVAVLLPDTPSSVRWEQFDRPYLDKALTAAGISHTIVNAQGDPTTQTTQADQAITNGAKVILLVDLDPGSGKAIIASAHAKGVKVIDYDRLTLGGGADFYVSFDNTRVGQLQGQGLVNCIKQDGLSKPVVAELNGSPTDNNATLFANGYNSVLNPQYSNGTFSKGPNQSVPDWDNQKALTIYEQMLQQTGNKINAVLAANDGLGNAVVSALKARKLKQIPVTGQDATAQGVQNIIAGDQCMTVLKDIKKEAQAAASLAKSLISGGKATGVNAKVSDGKRQVPSVLLTPVAITKANYKTLFTLPAANGTFLKKSDVCKGAYAKFCK